MRLSEKSLSAFCLPRDYTKLFYKRCFWAPVINPAWTWQFLNTRWFLISIICCSDIFAWEFFSLVPSVELGLTQVSQKPAFHHWRYSNRPSPIPKSHSDVAKSCALLFSEFGRHNCPLWPLASNNSIRQSLGIWDQILFISGFYPNMVIGMCIVNSVTMELAGSCSHI